MNIGGERSAAIVNMVHYNIVGVWGRAPKNGREAGRPLRSKVAAKGRHA